MPSAEEVKDLFISFYGTGSAFNTQKFEDSLAPEHKLSVNGYDFVAGGADQVLREFYSDVSGPILKAVDTNKSIKYQVLNVIASSDTPWVAVVAKTTATTKKGKPWVNEAVSIVQFSKDNKIVELKLYMDTQHVHAHIVEHA